MSQFDIKVYIPILGSVPLGRYVIYMEVIPARMIQSRIIILPLEALGAKVKSNGWNIDISLNAE
jgi:hypothetical protein